MCAPAGILDIFDYDGNVLGDGICYSLTSPYMMKYNIEKLYIPLRYMSSVTIKYHFQTVLCVSGKLLILRNWDTVNIEKIVRK